MHDCNVWIQPFIFLEYTLFYLIFVLLSLRGCRILQAEIIPLEPEPDNAGGGR